MKRPMGTRGVHRRLVCRHDPVGTVAWPAEYDPTARLKVSVYCCAKKACIRDAAQWVAERTGHLGVWRTLPVVPMRRAS